MVGSLVEEGKIQFSKRHFKIKPLQQNHGSLEVHVHELSTSLVSLEGELVGVLQDHRNSDRTCPVEVQVGQLVGEVVPEISWNGTVGVIVDHLESSWGSATFSYLLGEHEPVENVFLHDDRLDK